LESLSPSAEREGVELFHASPRDPVWDYVLSLEAVEASFELTKAPLILVGHSHVPLAVAVARGALAGGLAHDGTEAECAPAARVPACPPPPEKKHEDQGHGHGHGKHKKHGEGD